jgi:hypothetical protein
MRSYPLCKVLVTVGPCPEACARRIWGLLWPMVALCSGPTSILRGGLNVGWVMWVVSSASPSAPRQGEIRQQRRPLDRALGGKARLFWVLRGNCAFARGLRKTLAAGG